MRKLGILLAAILAISLGSSNARAGYIDIKYDLGNSTAFITSPITVIIPYVSHYLSSTYTYGSFSGSMTARFSTTGTFTGSVPVASMTVQILSFAANIIVDMPNVITGVTNMNFLGMTGGPMHVVSLGGGYLQVTGTAGLNLNITGALHCAPSRGFCNPLGLPVSQVTSVGAVTVLPAPIMNLAISAGAFTATQALNMAILPPPAPSALGTTSLAGVEVGTREVNVAEPGSFLLLGAGVAGLAGISLVGHRRRRR